MPTEPKRADLHSHSRCSDGSCTIPELLTLAKAEGLDALAVTDHDTFAGVAAAQALGRELGITVVHGIEISSKDPATGRKVHILGYLCKNTEPVETLCRRTLHSRNEGSVRSAEIISKLYHLPVSYLLSQGSLSTCIYKQHIMRALMDAGYATEMFGEVFHRLFSSKGGLAFSKTDYPTAQEAIAAVHEAGGLAVLAHPDAYQSGELLRELVREKRLDGAEVYHPRNLPENIPAYEALCRENGLLITGGSDFHGGFSRTIRLGTCTTPPEMLERMLNQ